MNYLYPIALVFSLSSCSQTTQSPKNVDGLNVEFNLPQSLKEVSGIALSKDGKMMFAIEDQGNKNTVYSLDLKGNIVKETTIKDAENNDWEDITTNQQGEVFIGNFGNNENDRKDLSVLKVDVNSGQVLQTTTFYYPEQKDFPPKKSDLLYDCEGFVVFKNNFYLFTKNRSKNFDGSFLVYKVPNQSGSFPATLVGKLKLEGKFDDAAITSATINSIGDEIVLLSHKKIHTLRNFHENDFSKAVIKSIDLDHNSQKESIVYKDDKTLYIADEREKKEGGNVYIFPL